MLHQTDTANLSNEVDGKVLHLNARDKLALDIAKTKELISEIELDLDQALEQQLRGAA